MRVKRQNPYQLHVGDVIELDVKELIVQVMDNAMLIPGFNPQYDEGFYLGTETTPVLNLKLHPNRYYWLDRQYQKHAVTVQTPMRKLTSGIYDSLSQESRPVVCVTRVRQLRPFPYALESIQRLFQTYCELEWSCYSSAHKRAYGYNQQVGNLDELVLGSLSNDYFRHYQSQEHLFLDEVGEQAMVTIDDLCQQYLTDQIRPYIKANPWAYFQYKLVFDTFIIKVWDDMRDMEFKRILLEEKGE